MQLENLLDIEAVGRDEALLARVAAARVEPADVLVSGDDGVLGVDALAGPVGDPVGRALEELGGAEGVWQKDQQLAAVALLPKLQHAVLRGVESGVVVGERGHGHGKLVRVGAHGFEVVLVGEEGVGGAGEAGAEGGAQGLDDVLLPEEAVAAAGAELGDADLGHGAQALDLLPEARLGAGVEDVELHLVEAGERGAGAHLADQGEGVDLPHGDLGPEAGEAEDELAVLLGDGVIGEAEAVFEPGEEGGLEDLARAVEGVAGEPDQLGAAEAQAAQVLHLRDEGGRIDLVGEADARGAVDDLAGDVDGGEVLPDELEHEQLVEVGVEQRADDGVELPVVVVRALGEVDIHADHCRR